MRFTDIKIKCLLRRQSQALGNNTSDCEVRFELTVPPPSGWLAEFYGIVAAGRFPLATRVWIEGYKAVGVCAPKDVMEFLRQIEQVILAANANFRERNKDALATQRELDLVLDELKGSSLLSG